MGPSWKPAENAFMHEAATVYSNCHEFMAHMKAGGFRVRTIGAYASRLSDMRLAWPDLNHDLLKSFRHAQKLAKDDLHPAHPIATQAVPFVMAEAPVVKRRSKLTWLQGEEEALRVAVATATSFAVLSKMLETAGFRVRTPGAYRLRTRNHEFDWHVDHRLAEDFDLLDAAQKKSSKDRILHRKQAEREEIERSVRAELALTTSTRTPVMPMPSVSSVPSVSPVPSVPSERTESRKEQEVRWDRDRKAITSVINPVAKLKPAAKITPVAKITTVASESVTNMQKLAFMMVKEGVMDPERAMAMVRRSVK